MKTLTKYSPEVRERAVRLVFEHRAEYESQWAAVCSIAGKIGCTAETLRRWVRHVLAHANGRLDLAKEDTRRSLETWCGENRGLSAYFDLLIVSADYTRAAQILVTDTLSNLRNRVRAEFSG
ncbi:ISPsy21, transposase orfA [Nitrococcus mobilis Nb-231]|uniref:ISPsy21, transposase orfA n=1 Tax=Nitrococcus mobilis Nb-231 TaxID=314278 RepID=A4BV15_9GAMM|nr:ISPsy21, transposase orfA [Nitrococcus mobilis Nb-231]